MQSASKPYERIEARDDGYLWVVNYEDKTEQQPLLLHAAASLLRQLQEKWHKDVVFSQEDDDDDDDDDEEQVDEKKDDTEKEEEDGGDDIDDDNDEEDEDPTEGPEEITNTAPTNNRTPIDYSSLERTLNLGDRIITTLTHIRFYKHDNRKRRRNNQTATEIKVKALQHQRDRLQQQKDQQQQKETQSASAEDKTNTADNEKEGEEEFQVVGKKKEENEEEDAEENEVQDPYIRLARALNSVRALAPILRPLLFHPYRLSHDLRCGAKKIRLPNKKRASSWLLGRHVFDVATAGGVKNMQLNLQEILEFYLPCPIVAALINNTLEQEDEFWKKDWLLRTWPSQETTNSIHLGSPYNILAEFLTDDTPNKDVLGKIQKQCQACDDKFFAKKPNDGGKAISEHKRYEQAVQKLHSTLSRILERDFPNSRLSIYGSCLSNLSLKASDVDLSLFLPQAEQAKKSFQNGFWEPARYEKEMTRLVRDVFRRLVRRKGEFKDMVPVTRARVPVVKGCYMYANNPYTADGSLHFDICFLNDIAVANSSLLREYSLFDDSVRELMVVVKEWAKSNKICSAQDNTLSSYAWLNMVIFYLQCSGYIPNLQCPKLMEQVGLQRSPNEYWHNVNDLDTCYLTLEDAKKVWKRPEQFDEEPISNTALLYGFFNFYAIGFLRSISMISIKRGNEEILPKTVFRKCSPFFCIEDPFETFDSHMPHDLGIPVNESQTKRIFQLLQDAEEHLRKHLLGQDTSSDEDTESEFTSLWPWPPKEPEKIKNDGGGGGGRGRRRGRGKEGGRNKDNKKEEARDDAKQRPKEQPKAVSKAHPNKPKAKHDDGKKEDSKNAVKKTQDGKESAASNNHPKKDRIKGKNSTQEAGQNPVEAKGKAPEKAEVPHSKEAKKDGKANPHHAGGRGRGPGRGQGRGHRKPDNSHSNEEKKDVDNHGSGGQGRGNRGGGGRGGRGRGGRGRGRGRHGQGGRRSGGNKAKAESTGNQTQLSDL